MSIFHIKMYTFEHLESIIYCLVIKIGMAIFINIYKGNGI